MSLKNDPFFYETFRPNYELRAATAWFAVSLFYLFYTSFDYFLGPSQIIFFLCLGMGMVQFIPGYKRLKQTLRLAGTPLPFLTFDGLKSKMKDKVHRSDIWLGKGFKWSKTEAQNVHQLLDRDWKEIQKDALGPIYYWRFFRDNKALFFLNPFRFVHDYRETQKRVTERGGQPWIHGCGPKEEDLYLPISETERHTFIIGSTGSGKTRCFDLLICQAILRGETVIVIDPKADPDLQQKIARACRELHREQDYYNFNPATPEKSVKLNLLASWTQPTELASRIAQLMPSGGSSDPFTSFAWHAINAIAQAYCNTIKRNPTLKSFLSFIEGEMPYIVCEVIETYLLNFVTDKDISNFYATLKREVRDNYDLRANALIRWYRGMGRPDQSVDGLIGMFEHDKEHFSKMITSLIPTLSMLTSGNVGEMLSPPSEDERNMGRISRLGGEHHKSIASLIKSNAVLYIGLNNLADAKVGSAIGSLVIADITATAGMRYNYEENQNNMESSTDEYGILADDLEGPEIKDRKRTKPSRAHVKPINIFIDEAAEVTSNPLIQLLNKGRGAKVKAFVATQTIADFAKVMGSKDAATMILGNLNNFICLQIQDMETAKYFANKFPTTKIVTIQHSQSQNIGAEAITASGASITQRRVEEDDSVFPQCLLPMLPPLEFIALLAGGNVVKGRFPILIAEDCKPWYKRIFGG